MAQAGSDSSLHSALFRIRRRWPSSEADAIVLVVDGRDGLTAGDAEVAEVLRRSDKPVFVAVNKAEASRCSKTPSSSGSLGLGEPYPISAYHGDGVGDLLDELVKVLPRIPPRKRRAATSASPSSAGPTWARAACSTR
jgi:predicted GTPase